MALPPLGAPPPVDPAMFDPGPPPETDPVLAPPETPPGQDMIERSAPEPDEKRRLLVEALSAMVRQGKTHWDRVFKRMEVDMRFAAGVQWTEDPKISIYNDVSDNDLYVANITLQHIQKKVAQTYAKNPKAVCRRRPRILSTVWDGTMESLAQAQNTMMQAQQAMMLMATGGAGVGLGGPFGVGASTPPMPAAGPSGGAPAGPSPTPGDATGSPGAPGPETAPGATTPMSPIPTMPPPEVMMQAQAVLADAQNVKQQLTILNKIARTLEILYDYEISEQQQPFKSMMKMTARRAATSGVGYVRIGFQRVMEPTPDKDSRIADIQNRLDLIERVSADIADNEVEAESAEAEQMRLAIQAIQEEQDVVVREGLMFSYPKPTAIIPDPRMVQLREFLGCDWVAEEFCLSVNEIQETYRVDVSKSHRTYTRTDTGTDYERARAAWQTGSSSDPETDNRVSSGDGDSCLVWELFNKKDGLVYKICDGYPDFLAEPSPPDVYTDRFWPWYLVAYNEIPGQPFPISDVSLGRPMQRELNRSRQGLREHRIANRPKTAYADGVLSEEDIDAFKNHPVNAMIAVSGLQPGQDINTVLQAVKGSPVDPNLYEVNPVFQDLLRVWGDQEADLGGSSGDTATEASIGASAKASAVGSSVDDMDETLTGMARAAGQILLLNVSEDTVKSIVGPGAMWPTLTKAEVARDLYLDIEAGSSGKPNQAQEIQNFQQLAPILMQLPGVKPSWLAKEAIKRMDDKADVDEVIADGLPSIQALNGAAGGTPGLPGQPLPDNKQPGAQQAGPPQPNSQSPMAPPPSPAPPSPSPSTRLQ